MKHCLQLLVVLLAMNVSLATFVAMGFSVVSKSLLEPLPCVIYLFVKTAEYSPWALCMRYEHFKGTNPLANLIPGEQYQLAIACSDLIQAEPSRLFFRAVDTQQVNELMVGTFNLTDKPLVVYHPCVAKENTTHKPEMKPKINKPKVIHKLKPTSNQINNQHVDINTEKNGVETQTVPTQTFPTVLYQFIALFLVATTSIISLLWFYKESQKNPQTEDWLVEQELQKDIPSEAMYLSQ